jgi:hypothetical protein
MVQFVFTHSERPQRLPEYHEGEYKKYVYCSRESEEYALLDIMGWIYRLEFSLVVNIKYLQYNVLFTIQRVVL